MTAAEGAAIAIARPRSRLGQLALQGAAVLALAALAATTVLRFVIAGHQPLWLDETWTAAIVGQPGSGAFWRQVRLDVNAPLYYLVMHLWQGLFGLSDVALRVPSGIFGAAAPLAVAFTGVKGLSRPARLTWAALLALWIPGIWLSGDARCYALLLLLTTAQTLAFLRLLREPGAGRAALWAALAALAILTHYHAAILAALQGLAYLAWARGRALRTWPAGLIFVPVAAWLALHLPRIGVFMRPEIAWYPKLRWDRLGRVADYLVGTPSLGFWYIGIAIAALVLGFALNARARASRRPTALAWIAVGVSVAGALIVVGAGLIRPSYTDRYLTPFQPALLLAVALIAQGLSRRLPVTYAAVIVAAAAFVWPWATTELKTGWRYYNWEEASRDLIKGHPRRLVFFWDHPASQVLARDQLDPVGGFFFARAHRPVAVTSVVAAPGQDPNRMILAAASAPDTAIIWAYDLGVQGTAARRFPPRLDEMDPTLTCHDYARGSVGVVACDRADSVRSDDD